MSADKQALAELRQAVWDAYGILGFDQDGDTTPNHLACPPFPDFVRQFATEMRKDYDDACAEACEFARKADACDRIAQLVAHPQGTSDRHQLIAIARVLAEVSR